MDPLAMMNSSPKADPALDDFLSRVDEVGGLISDLAHGTDGETVATALKKADDLLEKDGTVGVDRMVINRAALVDDPAGGPRGPPGGPMAGGVPFEAPEGASAEQTGFMAELERDSQERYERKQKNAAEAAVLKGKGNEAFKAEEFDSAIELYTAAIRLDPGNALLYTNCAQAHLKVGNFEAAVERCDIAIRADEKCFKAYLRRGIALRSMGEYGRAVESFNQGKKLVPADQRKTFDKHIEECAVAKTIAGDEERLDKAMQAGDDDDALKAIERGSSRLALSGLKPNEYLSTTGELIRLISTSIHQDLFRLRKGLRILADSVVVRTYLNGIVEPNGAISAAPTPDTAQTQAHMAAACTSAALRLLAVAARKNEASCRELFKAGAKDVALFTQLILFGADAVRGETLATLIVACDSPFVRRLLSHSDNSDLVAALSSTFEASAAPIRTRVDAAVCYSLLATEESFRARCRHGFVDEVYPQLGTLLDCGGSLAEAGLLALTNLAGDHELRRELAETEIVSELFGFAETWSQNLLDGVQQDGINYPAVLYKLLGLLLNVTIEPSAMLVLQQHSSLDCIITLLDLSTEKVFTRAAALVARACTVKQVAEHLIFHGGAQRLIEIAETCPHEAEFLDAAVKTTAKIIPLYPAARGVVASERAMRIWCKLLHHAEGRVVGNAALCISECAKDQQVCMELVGTTVVADLLNIARKEKSKLTENCAIALARLASGHPEHIARLRQLGGFEVLHSRSPVAVPR